MWNTKFLVFVTVTTVFISSSVYCKEQFGQQVAGDREFSLSEDAKKLRDAIVGLGTDENTIPMMRDIGHVNSTLVKENVKYIPTKRDDCDAAKNNYVKLMLMMAKDSFEQIRFTVFEYESQHNTSVAEAIKANCDEPIAKAFNTIVSYAKNPAGYYAEIIRKSTVGLGTSDDTLIRTIVSRQEIDLAEIKQAYKQMYHTTLTSSIASETSGYYKKTLLALIGPE
ncbi:hypothetical protein LSTR_LSTR008883 [Laodelphax striatellus]|uniref:Annexin n=1 Tax=Laodelphax striatellus TaxID=195883 RepID=A0A482WLE5_LAOST|nr:hypothetical protein LSTR_LSTR008883 [Laodelphax striatellus]